MCAEDPRGAAAVASPRRACFVGLCRIFETAFRAASTLFTSSFLYFLLSCSQSCPSCKSCQKLSVSRCLCVSFLFVHSCLFQCPRSGFPWLSTSNPSRESFASLRIFPVSILKILSKTLRVSVPLCEIPWRPLRTRQMGSPRNLFRGAEVAPPWTRG